MDCPMYKNETFDKSGMILIQEVLRSFPLDSSPGSEYIYSNFGYVVLGRAIEKITGMTYQNFVTSNILTRCGINGMRIGFSPPGSDEVQYNNLTNEWNPNLFFDIRRMDSSGGWVANPIELLKILARVDLGNNVPDILRRDTILTMTRPSRQNPNYSLGWSVWDNNWSHSGFIQGVRTTMTRNSQGFNWVILMNSCYTPEMSDGDFHELFWEIHRAVPRWSRGIKL